MEVQNLRSLRSRDKAYVRFINCTERTVEVVWINFTGSYVNYQSLERGRFVDINTYKRHPWIALDHHTRDRLHIEKQFVYYPKTTKEYFEEQFPNKALPPDFEARIRAAITLPVYSLRYTCLLAVRDLLRIPEDVESLEIPKEVADDLKKAIFQKNNQSVLPLVRIG